MLVGRGDLYEVKALSGKPSSPNFPMNGRFGTLGSCQFAFRLDVIFVFSNIIERPRTRFLEDGWNCVPEVHVGKKKKSELAI